MTPALWARLFVAAIVEAVRGFRFSGNSLGRSAEVGSVDCVACAAEDGEGFMAAVGLLIDAASS